eukprot:4626436-Alexandrium_andersonii.AAC.1
MIGVPNLRPLEHDPPLVRPEGGAPLGSSWFFSTHISKIPPTWTSWPFRCASTQTPRHSRALDSSQV